MQHVVDDLWGGDLAQARAYLMRALAIFERLGTLREPERIRQLLALQEGVR